ncbi:MAG: thioredoxin [Ignavibacteriae bacterium]|nr:thioredoxin [Ignavibacteria bacterium]MBI3363880.1 thioredoxin [Ignavibacteriota bacterium]
MKPRIITDAQFEQEVLSADRPVLVDFWADWCGPCKMIAPFVEELAVEYDGKLNVAKMDVDANPRTAMQYGIRSIPTLMVFKNGQVVEQIIGAVPKRHLVEKVKPHLIERDMISHSIRDKEFEEAVLNANE